MNAVRAAVAAALAVLLLAGCTGGSRARPVGLPVGRRVRVGVGRPPRRPPAVPRRRSPRHRPRRRCGPATCSTTDSSPSPPATPPAVPCRRRHTAQHDLRRQAGHGRRRARGRRRLGHRAAAALHHVPPQARAVRRRLGEAARPVPVQRGLVQPHAPAVGPGRQLVPLRPDRLRRARNPGAAPATRAGDSRACSRGPGALATYGLCGTAAPGAPGFQRVICGQRHSWRAIDTIGLSGGARYPGRRDGPPGR